MNAKAFDIQCNRVVELDGYVEIRKLVDGNWVSKKRSYFHITTVPNKKEVRMVATKCKKGAYEPYLSITGNYQGDIEHLNYVGHQSTVKCKKKS